MSSSGPAGRTRCDGCIALEDTVKRLTARLDALEHGYAHSSRDRTSSPERECSSAPSGLTEIAVAESEEVYHAAIERQATVLDLPTYSSSDGVVDSSQVEEFELSFPPTLSDASTILTSQEDQDMHVGDVEPQSAPQPWPRLRRPRRRYGGIPPPSRRTPENVSELMDDKGMGWRLKPLIPRYKRQWNARERARGEHLARQGLPYTLELYDDPDEIPDIVKNLYKDVPSLFVCLVSLSHRLVSSVPSSGSRCCAHNIGLPSQTIGRDTGYPCRWLLAMLELLHHSVICAAVGCAPKPSASTFTSPGSLAWYSKHPSHKVLTTIDAGLTAALSNTE
ncbi:unnamed protein product [Peniophora sp. CBMAI 1063]|nr:unnamed protein product [Peniophora sp. CBMAI 1063]